jgi:hypothetical protein
MAREGEGWRHWRAVATEEAIARSAEQARALWEATLRDGAVEHADAVLRLADGLVHRVRAMDERHPLRPRAAGVAATACYTLAQGLKDALRFGLAERWFLRAASLAALAEDRDLQVEALCSGAAMLAYQGRTEAAKARIMPLQSDSPADASYYAAIEKAVTFASLWDLDATPTREDAYVALSALDRSEATAEKLDDRPPSFLLSRPREGMAEHWRGHILARLGHTKNAYRVLIGELATLPFERRSARGKVHASLADVSLQTRAVDVAVWHLEKAFLIAKDTKSPHELRRIRRLRQRIGPWWSDTRSVRELDELMREGMPDPGPVRTVRGSTSWQADHRDEEL